MTKIDYFQGYPQNIRDQFEPLIKNGEVRSYLLNKYPIGHQINSDKQLYEYANKLKQSFMKKSPPITKVKYVKQKNLIFTALGDHTSISGKHEIRIAVCLKNAPEEMLQMLVVHELAHFQEKDHTRAFYNLCVHMQPDYCDVEVDTLLYQSMVDQDEKLY
ncbi:metal-dependent hydrolase [Halobacteriovorax marinus]|uniref:Metal-dependent hydrolase n=1 Tax=Halobacteriovorax marinus TaxID=97084 RepID=A0A1Y5F5C0_9BACT|nr:metal-dependent hydrolase [Halobacteriovorax marinus]